MLLDAELSNESKQQLNDLLEEFSDIMSKNSKDIHLTHLEEMVLPTEPKAAIVASKSHDLPLKHHRFVKEELTNLLKAGLIERSLNPYAAPIIVVPQKHHQGVLSLKLKDWLLVIVNSINNSLKFKLLRLNPEVALTSARQPRLTTLCLSYKVQGIFPLLILGQGTITFLYTQSQDQKLHLFALMVNSSGRVSYGIAHAPSVFLSTVGKLFFNYLDDFMISYVDDVIIYTKTEQDHITHLWKIFEKFCYASLKLKPSKCAFFKLYIVYFGHLIPVQKSTPQNKRFKQF